MIHGGIVITVKVRVDSVGGVKWRSESIKTLPEIFASTGGL